MKGKALYLSAMAMAFLAGCSTTPETQEPEPLFVDPVIRERCYSMDMVKQEASGYAYLEKGRQFYLHTDCEKYLAMESPQDFGVTKTVSKNKGGLAAKASSKDPGGSATNDKSGSALDGAPNAYNVVKEPNCYYDKETAGRGDLPPCEWDEEKQEYIIW